MEEKKLTDELEDLLIEFDEMSFFPATLCPNSEEFVMTWKQRLIAEIRRLQSENENLKATVKIHVMDIDELHREREKRVEEVYPNFMQDYKIMRDELNSTMSENAEQKEEIERLTEKLRIKTNEADWRGDHLRYMDEREETLEKQNAELQKQVDELAHENDELEYRAEQLEKQLIKAVKDMAKEILSGFYLWIGQDFDDISDGGFIHIMKEDFNRRMNELYKRYGVEVE